MVVVALVWSADDHDDEVLAVIRAEVIDRRLQEVLVLFDPLGEIQRRREWHSGCGCGGGCLGKYGD